MQESPKRVRLARFLAPYLLIAPVLVFLSLVFAYPMIEGLKLAIRDGDALLPVLADPSLESTETGRIQQGTRVDILDQRGNLITASTGTDLLTQTWFKVRVEGGIEGWLPESRVRVRQEIDGVAAAGTVRPKLGETEQPETRLRANPDEGAEVLSLVAPTTKVDIAEIAVLELWYQIRPAGSDKTPTGWAPSRFVQAFNDTSSGVVDRGTEGRWTTDFITKMREDRFFGPAWRTTLLLMLAILPAQFLLAMLMALVIHARIKLTSLFLYLFTVPMGMSDLAVGIIFFSIFTGNGLANSVLESLGLIDAPKVFLSAQTTGWIIFAIVLAEIWRSTSLVMVIIVSGLQAIPDEMLEAAELFGASYWQRVRHVMAPLLGSSIQVALILRTILAFQVFSVVVALGGGDVVTTLANETFRQYFDFRNDNVASVYAMFIMALSLTSAAFYLRAVRTQDPALVS